MENFQHLSKNELVKQLEELTKLSNHYVLLLEALIYQLGGEITIQPDSIAEIMNYGTNRLESAEIDTFTWKVRLA